MKVILKLIVVLILTLSSCCGLKRVNRLIDQKEEFFWTASASAKNYLLIVDMADGVWFTGKIIIDFKDTLYLKGFEKGNNHPTFVRQLEKDTIENTILGHIFIWTNGFSADTVVIENRHDIVKQLPKQLYLIKTRKKLY